MNKMCKSNISSGKRPLEGDKTKKEGQGHSVVGLFGDNQRMNKGICISVRKIIIVAKISKEICCRVVVAKETCFLEVVKLKAIHTYAEMSLERISKMSVIYNPCDIPKIILNSQKAISERNNMNKRM